MIYVVVVLEVNKFNIEVGENYSVPLVERKTRFSFSKNTFFTQAFKERTRIYFSGGVIMVQFCTFNNNAVF